jgi:orotate phosphoribosyltransferase
MINMVKLPTNNPKLFLRVAKGHFATSHSHINYYIDVTTQKSRLSEAKEVAKELTSTYRHSTIVDTVLCLDGTQVVGTCLANELTKDGFTNMNAHQTIYIITPEYTSGSQIILRDNVSPMVRGKHVLILAASITTGYTVQAAIEAVQYYGGQVAGLSAIFSTEKEVQGYPVSSIFNPNNLPDYESFDARECPMCRAGQPIDALVNSFGYSALRGAR